jgi:hypothetical protein
MHRTGGEY